MNFLKLNGDANWLMGPVKSYLNENAKTIEDLPVTAESIAGLIQLVDEGKISHSLASQKLFPLMIKEPGKSPSQIAEENKLLQDSDADNINEFVRRAIEKYPDKVIEYKKGKKGLIGLFMGEVMKLSKGMADPKKANQIVQKMLNEC